jgi:hypothetical protein
LCSCQTGLVSDEAAAARVDSAVISARRFRIPGPRRQPRTASSFVSLTPAWLSAARQIRKTCGVPAYLRVVIEKHRTQASRTMNAETAQVVAKRVN